MPPVFMSFPASKNRGIAKKVKELMPDRLEDASVPHWIPEWAAIPIRVAMPML